MQTRTPRALLATAALALLAGACTDTPTDAPSARAPGERASFSTSSSGPTLISNAVKYRDTGGKPATGRSGNAVMSAMAVLDKEGVTTLNFHARHAIQTWREGTVTRAQVKASSPDGAHKYTRNLEPYFGHHGPIPGTQLLHGLGRGDQVQLQANVEGIDAPRVDVVTVAETVKRLPDLTLDVTAPGQVEANTPVNVLGVVRERNGDLGVFAYCELYVDDELVDIVWNLWVDAGDAVTCATTVSFGLPGTYAVRMRVRTSWEREWDTENNTDTATIQVSGATPRFFTSASFSQSTMVDSSTLYETWEYPFDGTGGEYRAEIAQVFTGQYGDMYGYMPARMPGPVDLQVGMSTGGRVVDAAQWSEPGSFEGCTSYWGGRTTFHLCSNGDLASGSTSFTYSYMAGSATYHSREYSRVWDHLTGEEWVYHLNTEYAYDENVPLGDDWTFTVRFSTPSAEHDLSRTLPLEPFGPYSWSQPYDCFTWGDPSWGYYGTSCAGANIREWGLAGYATD